MRSLTSQSSDLFTDLTGERLWLTPPWARDPVALVPAVAIATEPEDDPSDVLAPAEARWLFENLAATEPGRVREFVLRAGVGSPSYRASYADLRQLIVDRIDAGSLLAVRSFSADDVPGPWRALRELVRNIAAVTAAGMFRVGGRECRLLAGIDLMRFGDRNQYELASKMEAERIIGEASRQNNAPPALVSLLTEAREKLSNDWRPPLEPDGLVLLRRVVTNRVIRPNDIPILTPSQMVPREEKSWIEIELVDENGEPYSGDVELTLADGRKVRASSNAKGLLRLDGIAPGNCQVTLPDLDASSWAPN
jgi:hypothetical protein